VLQYCSTICYNVSKLPTGPYNLRLHYVTFCHSCVNAKGVTGLQGSVKAMDACNTATQSKVEGEKGDNQRGGPPQYLKCVDAHAFCRFVF